MHADVSQATTRRDMLRSNPAGYYDISRTDGRTVPFFIFSRICEEGPGGLGGGLQPCYPMTQGLGHGLRGLEVLRAMCLH